MYNTEVNPDCEVSVLILQQDNLSVCFIAKDKKSQLVFAF